MSLRRWGVRGEMGILKQVGCVIIRTRASWWMESLHAATMETVTQQAAGWVTLAATSCSSSSPLPYLFHSDPTRDWPAPSKPLPASAFWDACASPKSLRTHCTEGIPTTQWQHHYKSKHWNLPGTQTWHSGVFLLLLHHHSAEISSWFIFAAYMIAISTLLWAPKNTVITLHPVQRVGQSKHSIRVWKQNEGRIHNVPWEPREGTDYVERMRWSQAFTVT